MSQPNKHANTYTQKVLNALPPCQERSILDFAYRFGLVRFVKVEDEHYRFEDLCGDCYKPEVNPDIDPKVLAQQKASFRSRVSRQGVWGTQLWVRARADLDWQDGDISTGAIYGFVGDDFMGSGYDTDMMNCAAEWLVGHVDWAVLARDHELLQALAAAKGTRLTETL